MSHLIQNKDTRLLCLDGCDGRSWDEPASTQPGPDVEPEQHGAMYCAFASVAMMASAYGSRLSQDRIAVWYAKETDHAEVDNQLRHGVGVTTEVTDEGRPITDLLEWAFGLQENDTRNEITYQKNATPREILNWINDGRPVMILSNEHFEVIQRCVIESQQQGNDSQIHGIVTIFDPYSSNEDPLWYDTVSIDGVWVGPNPSSPWMQVRNDEPGVSADTDDDGIMDFDEEFRLDSSANDKDSDDDLVEDKAEVMSYVFNESDACIANTEAAFYESDSGFLVSTVVYGPDHDNDRDRKEGDRDNDGDCCLDGQEDADHDGFLDLDPELNETSCFSDRDCAPDNGSCGCSCGTSNTS
jgi:hypothetical protein